MAPPFPTQNSAMVLLDKQADAAYYTFRFPFMIPQLASIKSTSHSKMFTCAIIPPQNALLFALDLFCFVLIVLRCSYHISQLDVVKLRRRGEQKDGLRILTSWGKVGGMLIVGALEEEWYKWPYIRRIESFARSRLASSCLAIPVTSPHCPLTPSSTLFVLEAYPLRVNAAGQCRIQNSLHTTLFSNNYIYSTLIPHYPIPNKPH